MQISRLEAQKKGIGPLENLGKLPIFCPDFFFFFFKGEGGGEATTHEFPTPTLLVFET